MYRALRTTSEEYFDIFLLAGRNCKWYIYDPDGPNNLSSSGKLLTLSEHNAFETHLHNTYHANLRRLGLL